MTKHAFNKSSKPYFRITFTADGLDANKFARDIGMTPTGMAASPLEGWDFQAGVFRPDHESVVHLLTTYSEECSYYAVDSYTVIGIAEDKDSREKIKPVFYNAVKAIAHAGGKVDRKSLKKPKP